VGGWRACGSGSRWVRQRPRCPRRGCPRTPPRSSPHPLRLPPQRHQQWKRKAEQYLIASGLNYTIIHPGGLIDEAGGSRALVLDVDDKLLERNPRNIPRADVAALAVGCIGLKEAANKSFDVICAPQGEGSASTNWGAVLRQLGFKSCDYSINSQLEAATV
jgi:hypothetical protein